MKKLLIALITLVMLAGCTAKDFNIVFKNKILRSVKDACDVELPEFSANNSHKEFYNYYLFQGIGRKEIDEISNIFVIYDNEAVLNLDVAGILSRSVYSETDLREIESFESKSLKTNGTCKNSRGIDMAYHIEIKVISETAFIIMQTNQFVFTASCPVLETDETVYEMMKTLRTCSVDTNKSCRVFLSTSRQMVSGKSPISCRIARAEVMVSHTYGKDGDLAGVRGYLYNTITLTDCLYGVIQ